MASVKILADVLIEIGKQVHRTTATSKSLKGEVDWLKEELKKTQEQNKKLSVDNIYLKDRNEIVCVHAERSKNLNDKYRECIRYAEGFLSKASIKKMNLIMVGKPTTCGTDETKKQ